jgi:hypothetical protein
MARESLADTGFVVAIFNQQDRWRTACMKVYAQEKSILLPFSTLPEIAYLLRREAGNDLVIRFLTQLPQTKFQLEAIEVVDLQRSAMIMQKYRDANLDFVDTTVMAVAERKDIRRILTVDQRDFSLVKPTHCPYFELAPERS